MTLTPEILVAWARQRTPRALLDAYRRFKMELPIRLRDGIPDLLEVLGGTKERLPPARVRKRIGRTSSREEYLAAGAVAAEEIAQAFNAAREPEKSYPAWLDFGCGSGRIARHLLRLDLCQALTGVDVDATAVAWARRSLPQATFERIAPSPPTRFPSASFDLIVAASVFTHLTAAQQDEWLAELGRLLKPGGFLVASTHGAELHSSRPDLSPADLDGLEREGFAFAGRAGGAKDDTAFHSRAYLERHWSRWLELRSFQSAGLFRYQDLSVWVRRG